MYFVTEVSGGSSSAEELTMAAASGGATLVPVSLSWPVAEHYSGCLLISSCLRFRPNNPSLGAQVPPVCAHSSVSLDMYA